MQRIAALSLKKKALISAGLLAFVAAIITGIYTTSRADSNHSATGNSAVEAADMNFEVKVDNGLIEPESATNFMESNTSSSSSQQGNSSASPNVDVTVNGTPIEVPQNGTVQKEISNEDGSASINISSQSNTSSGTTRTKSKIKVDVDSSVRIRNQTSE